MCWVGSRPIARHSTPNCIASSGWPRPCWRVPLCGIRQGEFEGVALKALPAPRRRSLEAILHSLLAAFYCRSQPCDLVHVHAIGPGLVVPLLRLLGKKVVFTHHGPDYDRQKWGRLAKWVLRLGERWAVRYANEVIVISEVINDAIRREYDRQDAHLIYNGVRPVELPGPEAIGMTLGHFGLAPGGYLVAVGRFVEEEGVARSHCRLSPAGYRAGAGAGG